MQYKTIQQQKIDNNFSPSQHGMACCALMHSATYITFSQSGSHISLMSHAHTDWVDPRITIHNVPVSCCIWILNPATAKMKVQIWILVIFWSSRLCLPQNVKIPLQRFTKQTIKSFIYQIAEHLSCSLTANQNTTWTKNSLNGTSVFFYLSFIFIPIALFLIILGSLFGSFREKEGCFQSDIFFSLLL